MAALKVAYNDAWAGENCLAATSAVQCLVISPTCLALLQVELLRQLYGHLPTPLGLAARAK